MGTDNSQDKEVVVLLHGILKSRFDMVAVATYLRNKDYDVINLSYPSRHHTLEELADYVDGELSKEGVADRFNNASKVHFVTHSMGGLVARYYLHTHRPDNLGRVVMMSPPNQGSEFANWMMEASSLRDLADNEITGKLTEMQTLQKIYRDVFGPAGAQLHTEHEHSIDPVVDFPLGVIAGNLSINPLAPWVLGQDEGGHDGIVPIARMRIDGMTDMIEMKATHSLMMYNPQVMKQIDHFLKHEKFDHEKFDKGPGPL